MKFRKKPEIVDAIQFTYNYEGINNLSLFCGKSLISCEKNRHPLAKGLARIGDEKSSFSLIEGDYVIKFGSGEFMPCKPDIFAATYDLVCDF